MVKVFLPVCDSSTPASIPRRTSSREVLLERVRVRVGGLEADRTGGRKSLERMHAARPHLVLDVDARGFEARAVDLALVRERVELAARDD